MATGGGFWVAIRGQENNLSTFHGERIRYDHEYPLYYPQAKSNPQPSFAYPDSALKEFRAWLRMTYIQTKFPGYLLGQSRQGKLDNKVALVAIEAFSSGKALPAPAKIKKP